MRMKKELDLFRLRMLCKILSPQLSRPLRESERN